MVSLGDYHFCTHDMCVRMVRQAEVTLPVKQQNQLIGRFRGFRRLSRQRAKLFMSAWLSLVKSNASESKDDSLRRHAPCPMMLIIMGPQV